MKLSLDSDWLSLQVFPAQAQTCSVGVAAFYVEYDWKETIITYGLNLPYGLVAGK